MGEGHAVLPALEADQGIDTDVAGVHHVERLGQDLRQWGEQPTLALPGLPHGIAGDGTQPAAGVAFRALVAPRLQLAHVAPAHPAGIGARALVAHFAFDLALRLRLPRRTGIHMKAHHSRIAAVARVDRAPGSRAVR